MSIYTSYEREILARLQVGQLMICKECKGQGYHFPANLLECSHCYGVGVMTPELRAALDRLERPPREGTNKMG